MKNVFIRSYVVLSETPNLKRQCLENEIINLNFSMQTRLDCDSKIT
jgi:hypothetical protein